jgi:hypothetical protein
MYFTLKSLKETSYLTQMQSQIVAGVSITCNQTNDGYNSLFNSYDLELLDTKVSKILSKYLKPV